MSEWLYIRYNDYLSLSKEFLESTNKPSTELILSVLKGYIEKKTIVDALKEYAKKGEKQSTEIFKRFGIYLLFGSFENTEKPSKTMVIELSPSKEKGDAQPNSRPVDQTENFICIKEEQTIVIQNLIAAVSEKMGEKLDPRKIIISKTPLQGSTQKGKKVRDNKRL